MRRWQRRESLRERILLGQAASDTVRASWRLPATAVLATSHDAFFAQQMLHIQYEDGGGRRRIEPQYMLINAPVWYLLAWDADKGEPRCFRLDRVLRAEHLPQGFARRSAARLMTDVAHYFIAL